MYALADLGTGLYGLLRRRPLNFRTHIISAYETWTVLINIEKDAKTLYFRLVDAVQDVLLVREDSRLVRLYCLRVEFKKLHTLKMFDYLKNFK